MAKLVTFLTVVLMSNAVYGVDFYDLQCESSVDGFRVEFDLNNKTIEFTERENFEIAVDPGVFKAEISEKASIITANVGTYDYFLGDVKFYLGKGLYKMKDQEQVRIALDADDGDGFGFSKRVYSCKVNHVVGSSTLVNNHVSYKTRPFV